jgi:hypothetical protein
MTEQDSTPRADGFSVEAVMPAEGITPGERVCHDAQKGRLQVDWVPDARPRPLALEVTAIVASEDEAGSRESVSLSERLTEVAEAEASARGSSPCRSIATSGYSNRRSSTSSARHSLSVS